MNPAEECISLEINKKVKPIKMIKSKSIYWSLQNRFDAKPSCINKWHEKYGITFTDSEWKSI